MSKGRDRGAHAGRVGNIGVHPVGGTGEHSRIPRRARQGEAKRRDGVEVTGEAPSHGA
jgi:hypothetical protein